MNAEEVGGNPALSTAAVDFIEQHMVFPGGLPQSNIFKRKFSFVFPLRKFLFVCEFHFLCISIHYKVTDAMKAKMDEIDLDTNVEVLLQRCLALERYLSNFASNPTRNRLVQVTIGKNRRRRQNRGQTFIYIGLRVNPDNPQRLLPTSNQLQTPIRTPIVVNRPPPTRDPAAPGPSTSEAYRVKRRLSFSTPAGNSTIDFSVTDAFGQLSLDSESD